MKWQCEKIQNKDMLGSLIVQKFRSQHAHFYHYLDILFVIIILFFTIGVTSLWPIQSGFIYLNVNK